MENTWWWYGLNHVLYEVRSPLVGYPVVKKGCIAMLESYREFWEGRNTSADLPPSPGSKILPSLVGWTGWKYPSGGMLRAPTVL